MNTRQLIELTAEKFAEIYTDEQLRNNIAYAHQCCDKNGSFKYLKTCSYPVEYIVTDDQRKEANIEIERAKAEKIKNLGNKLVFVGMGCGYEARYEDDVCNHRIRTEFINAEGKRFFVEFGTGKGDQMRVDFSIDRDMELFYENKREELYQERSRYKQGDNKYFELSDEISKWQSQPFYNYKGLERKTYLPKYTKANILQVVNETFGCYFQEVEIDNYTLRTEDFICKSPTV